MGLFTGTGIVAGIVGLLTGGLQEFGKWQERRDKIVQAEVDAKLAMLRASAELAAFKAKADVEWDLKWAEGAASSWKDEYILVLWSIPTICLFIPWLRPFVVDGFLFLKSFHPDAPTWFMAGWSIIFAATFGIKQALNYMLPAKYAALASAMGAIEDDIPNAVAMNAQAAINKAALPK